MLKNYFLIAARNLRKYKAYSLINIIGLTLGITCFILIMLFVWAEMSYDSYNKFASQIYRPTFFSIFHGRKTETAVCPAPLGPAAYHNFPEVIAYTRLRYEGSCMVRYKSKTFNEERFFWADSSLFDVFTLPFVTGDPKTALTQPNTVVITETTAHKYFGYENPIGKTLSKDKSTDYLITGVIKDIPQNSHFQPEFIGSLISIYDGRNPKWMSDYFYTYFLLKKGTNRSDFERKLNEEFLIHVSPQLKAVSGLSIDQFLSAGNKVGLRLQPLTSIHLNSQLDYELEQNGSLSSIYILSAIAIVILLIACINFINLTTARSEKRIREVGIRKTLGSPRSHLIWQFLAESILMSSVAVSLAMGIVEFLLPLFNDILDKKLSLDFFTYPALIPILIVLVIIVGVVAGGYPAFYISSFSLIDILKSAKGTRGRGSFFRNGLVVFQFVVSITLFIGTLVIYNQLRYIQAKDLGFDKEECVVINHTEVLNGQIHSFENKLRENKNIINITNSNSIPGKQYNYNGFWLDGTGVEKLVHMRTIECDYNFANSFKLQMINGRFFSKEHPSDSVSVIVNLEAEKVFGVKDIVGKYLILPGDSKTAQKKLKVVGVVKDFNYQSLHEPIQPLVISLLPERNAASFITVRLTPGNHLSSIFFIEKVWKKYAGDETFEFSFLDQALTQLYKNDQRTSKIAVIFSVLSIFIACLGLLGLVAFITEQRTKEIGIRKVLGASVTEMIALLSVQFVKWVLLANIIAWPLAYLIMNKWLQNFAYRTNLNIWIFLVSGAMALVIALLTVSSHAIKAATANPVKSLRYE